MTSPKITFSLRDRSITSCRDRALCLDSNLFIPRKDSCLLSSASGTCEPVSINHTLKKLTMSSTPLFALSLSPSTLSALARAGYSTVEEISSSSPEKLAQGVQLIQSVHTCLLLQKRSQHPSTNCAIDLHGHSKTQTCNATIGPIGSELDYLYIFKKI